MGLSSICAIGTAASEQYELLYSPTNPSEFTITLWLLAASNEPPSELRMRGSALSAAASARRAQAMRSSVGSEYTSSK